MIYSIDYYSFWIPVKHIRQGTIDETNKHVIREFCHLISEDHKHKFGYGNWGIEKGSGFYAVRVRHEPTGIALSYGDVNEHIFCEFSGRACQNLDAINALEPIIHATHQRCSRIDFACDILTSAGPVEFCSQRSSKAFKSNGEINSPTGQTCYFGSRKSDRMARVYRYFEPHPRSALLRVEAEYKGKAAKTFAKHFVETDVRTACLDAHKPFGWTHDTWDEKSENDVKIPYAHSNTTDASTVRWLYGDVISALRNAISKGIIDFDDWLSKLSGD